MGALRDFVYLDPERLRSFTAQLLGGIPEGAVSERAHETGAGATAGAGLFGFIKGQAEADYRYHRTSSETRSLHHHVYSLFEDELVARDLLKVIDADFDHDDGWTPSSFGDGEFVKVRGRIRLVDYGQSMSFVEGFPALVRSFKLIQLKNIDDSLASGEFDAAEAGKQRRELNEMEKGIKAMPTQHLSALGQTLYAPGVVRVKIHPDAAPPDHVLAGNGRLECLIDALGAGGVTQTPVGSSWVTVGQVTGADGGELLPIPTGNGVEDAVDAVSAAMRELVSTGSGVAFPALGFTPLAIYREVPTGRAS